MIHELLDAPVHGRVVTFGLLLSSIRISEHAVTFWDYVYGGVVLLLVDGYLFFEKAVTLASRIL